MMLSEGGQVQPGPGDEGATVTATVEPVENDVESVIRDAQSDGTITAADLAERLSVLDLTPDETDAIYQRLVELNVEIVEDEAVREELEEAEAPADVDDERRRARKEVDAALKAPTNDPVRMYLKEIGRVALLTAQEEVELAQRIEAGLLAEDKIEQAEEISGDE